MRWHLFRMAQNGKTETKVKLFLIQNQKGPCKKLSDLNWVAWTGSESLFLVVFKQ